jgi:hypothetical protein
MFNSVVVSTLTQSDGVTRLLRLGPWEPNAPRGRTVLHVKVRDLDIEAEVRRRMSAGESMSVPLGDVRIKAPPVEAPRKNNTTK